MLRCALAFEKARSGQTAEHLPVTLEYVAQRYVAGAVTLLLTKSCCSWYPSVPKIDVEPHPRGRFGPASPIKIMASEATIQTISKALGEADEGPLAQIQAVVDALGEETSLSLLAETDRIEKAGGMERGDGKGRRSPGGVFFYLARQKLPKEQRAAIFNDKMPREPKPPGWVPEKKGAKDSERSFPRRRVFEVNPGGSKFSGGGGGPGAARPPLARGA